MIACRVLLVLLLFFVGSGCVVLIYEIVWFQFLQLVIGSLAVSMGVLFGIFMGGMCFGSLFLVCVILLCEYLLKVYVYFELGIAVCGILLFFGMPFLGGIYFHWGGGGVMGILLRGVVVSICFLPLTFLMGAMFFAMLCWVEFIFEGVFWFGFFYGGNIGGGVIGCFLAGFYLLCVHDSVVVTFVVVGLNVLVVGFAFVIVKMMSYIELVVVFAFFECVFGAWVVYVVIGFLGMMVFSVEVIWMCILLLFFGVMVYTFSLILVVFLLGFGIGSSIGLAIVGRIACFCLVFGWC